MISFGFKRSCPLVVITQRRLPRELLPIEVGQRYEIDGAAFRKRWGTFTTQTRKVPHFPSNPRPICVVIAPHFPSESVPHFARNPHLGISIVFLDGQLLDGRSRRNVSSADVANFGRIRKWHWRADGWTVGSLHLCACHSAY
jgi:hypothetical protein